jgi:hypothetical protein
MVVAVREKQQQPIQAARLISTCRVSRRLCGGTIVNRRQAMHSSTAALSACRGGVNQRTLGEAQFSHFNMGV